MRNKSKISFLSVCLLAMILTALPAAAQWEMAVNEQVTSGSDFEMLSRRAMVIDDLGTVHAIYQRGVTDQQTLYYQQRPFGGTWSAPEVVGAAGTYPGSGWLELRKGTGEPYVVFFQNEVMTLGIRRTGGWEFHSLPTPAEYGVGKPAMAIDSLGHAHIAMLTVSDDPKIWQIAYGRWDGSGFSFQIVPGSVVGHHGLFAQPDIVVQKDGSVVTSYQHWNIYGQILVRVSENNAAGGRFWNHEEVDVPGVILYPESLEISDRGVLYLGFHTNIELGADHHVYYAVRKNNAFGTPEEVSGASTGARPRIALDKKGKPHLVFEETLGPRATGRLIHAYKAKGKWQQDVVMDNEAYTPTFLFDDAGNGNLLFERQIVQMEDHNVEYYGYTEPAQ